MSLYFNYVEVVDFVDFVRGSRGIGYKDPIGYGLD